MCTLKFEKCKLEVSSVVLSDRFRHFFLIGLLEHGMHADFPANGVSHCTLQTNQKPGCHGEKEEWLSQRRSSVELWPLAMG
jgi:hypothetical protein